MQMHVAFWLMAMWFSRLPLQLILDIKTAENLQVYVWQLGRAPSTTPGCVWALWVMRTCGNRQGSGIVSCVPYHTFSGIGGLIKPQRQGSRRGAEARWAPWALCPHTVQGADRAIKRNIRLNAFCMLRLPFYHHHICARAGGPLGAIRTRLAVSLCVCLRAAQAMADVVDLTLTDDEGVGQEEVDVEHEARQRRRIMEFAAQANAAKRQRLQPQEPGRQQEGEEPAAARADPPFGQGRARTAPASTLPPVSGGASSSSGGSGGGNNLLAQLHAERLSRRGAPEREPQVPRPPMSLLQYNVWWVAARSSPVKPGGHGSSLCCMACCKQWVSRAHRPAEPPGHHSLLVGYSEGCACCCCFCRVPKQVPGGCGRGGAHGGHRAHHY